MGYPNYDLIKKGSILLRDRLKENVKNKKIEFIKKKKSFRFYFPDYRAKILFILDNI